jgi:hypothetical protein
MIRSDAEVYAETGKRESWVAPARKNHPGKKINGDVKICKHLAAGGWCSKKNQRCPLLNLFINQ